MNNMKILFISLGCDKNLVDSEHMLGLLVEHGFEITDSEEDAEVIVINTCCFIHDAKEESIQNILEMAKYRTAGSCKVLLVTGCMAERYRDEIIEEIPEVDAVLGTNSYDKILDAIQDVLGGDRFQEYADLKGLPKIDAQRVVTTGGHYEYLKIAEGCDKHCTYCIIPKLRGPYRSVPMEELIAEAIRILYCYPEDIYPELVQTMKEEPKVCHYLDLPIQHANDEILRRMGRRTSKQELIDKIDFLRSEMPDITLRTTLITGFPGETKEQHKELLEFINDMEFDRLGVFTYSQEEGTPAAAMEHQIDEEVKLDRQAELMELQQDISAELGERRIGQELLVMIEGKVADEDAYVGRSQADAPGVDGYVFVNTPETLVSGDFVRVKITGALEYDLIGEISQ